MLVRLALHAMGTRFELVLEGDEDGPGAEAYLRAAGEVALAEVEQVDARLSLFRRDSLLSHIQRNAAEQPVRVDFHLDSMNSPPTRPRVAPSTPRWHR